MSRQPMRAKSIRLSAADWLWLQSRPNGYNASRAVRACLELARKVESLMMVGAGDVEIQRVLRETPGPWNRGNC